MPTSEAACKPSPPGAGGACATAGKWFRDPAGAKLFWNGIAYGPFKPNSRGGPWPEDAQLRADFAHIASLGFNSIRVYEPPTEEVLRACSAHGLRLLAGVPWTQHVDFLADKAAGRDAITRVRRAAGRLANEPCVAGLLIGNEIDKTLVRWMGPGRVRAFLEELVAAAKAEAPRLPVAYANYPSTEYLTPRNADFVACNVFLEQRDDFSRYLGRLQVIAGDRPLVVTEFGLDTKRHGEAAQAEVLRWEMEELRRLGAAGNFWFSYTDEWHRGGEGVTGWDFGIVTRDRKPKRVCTVLPGPAASGLEAPVAGISAVVCTRNGAATLRECLVALGRQSHPRHEVLVIDDGSTDATPEIAQEFPFVKYHRQDHAGLSAARNLGARLAQSGILAFTDDDCASDEDWLLHVATAFEDETCAAAGGPNLPPSPRTRAEAVVAAAPGAPAHVLAGDREAEHLPGCNLAIRKSALEAVGGFREEFTAAGDDVDLCWRLQAAGWKLLFIPSAVVWHHRRATVGAYLRQQRGYGFAEAQLIGRWPERFAWIGGARWRGVIYGGAGSDDLARKLIDFGPAGSALFPAIYTTHACEWTNALSGLPPMLLVFAMTIAGLFFQPALFAAAVLFGGTIAAAIVAALRRSHDRKPRSLRGTSLLAALCWLQPVVRDWARLRGMIALRARPRARVRGDVSFPSPAKQPGLFGSRTWSFWNREGGNDTLFHSALSEVCADAGTACAPVAGPGNLWDFKLTTLGMTAFIASVTEYHDGGGRLVRVRCSRPQWNRVIGWLWPLPITVCVLWAFVGPEPERPGRVGTGLSLQLAAAGLSILWDVVATRRFHSLVRQAASRCGWLAGGDSRAAPDSPLAALPASTKLPEHAP